MQFQEWVVGTGWTNDYGAGATAVSAAVENVHIKNVTCSNGTIDYFKWDPDGEEALQNPTLNFTIADADPHQYEWLVYFRKTSGDRTWVDGTFWGVSGNESALVPNTTTGVAEKAVTVNLASESLAGHLNRDVHPWCTYTYDIVVRELDGETQLDRYGLKEPYCMWVPKNPPGQEEGEGHSVWVHVPDAENAPAELRVKYAINDQCLTPNAQNFNLIVVDPLLQERAAIGKPWPDTTGVMHGVADADEDGQPDGIKVYEFADDDPGGTWRVLWTAEAPCGTKTRYRRTHDAQRMLVANQTTVKPVWSRYIYQYDPNDSLVGHAAVGATAPEGDGQGAWVFGWYPDGSPFGIPKGKLLMCYVPPGEDPLKQEREHAELFRAYEIETTQAGCMSTWTSVLGSWVTPEAAFKFLAAFSGHLDAEFSGSETTHYWTLVALPPWGYNCAHFSAINCGLGVPASLPALNPELLADYVKLAHDNEWLHYSKGRYFQMTGRWCGCQACVARRAGR